MPPLERDFFASAGTVAAALLASTWTGGRWPATTRRLIAASSTSTEGRHLKRRLEDDDPDRARPVLRRTFDRPVARSIRLPTSAARPRLLARPRSIGKGHRAPRSEPTSASAASEADGEPAGRSRQRRACLRSSRGRSSRPCSRRGTSCADRARHAVQPRRGSSASPGTRTPRHRPGSRAPGSAWSSHRY